MARMNLLALVLTLMTSCTCIPNTECDCECPKVRAEIRTIGKDYIADYSAPQRWEIVDIRTIPKIEVSGSTKRLPIEGRYIRVSATIVAVWQDAQDHTVELVLSDSAGNTIRAEIPNPYCRTVPNYAQQTFKDVLDVISRRFGLLTDLIKYVREPAEIRGIFYQNSGVPQLGDAPNSIRIAPIWRVEFRNTK